MGSAQNTGAAWTRIAARQLLAEDPDDAGALSPVGTSGPPSGRGMKTVLAVDGSRVVRAMVARHLERYGCRLVEAGSAWEGIRAARLETPALAFLDAALPSTDEGHLLVALRRDPRTVAVPVVLLATEGARPLVEELAPLGISGWLLKPFEQRAFDREAGKILDVAPAAVRRPVDRNAVLAVDADTGRIEGLRLALGSPFNVLPVRTSRDAVALYGRTRPAVVVIDLDLPEMEGFRAMSRLEELGPSAFVALVARGGGEARDWAWEVGCHAVLENPVLAQALAEQVRLAAAAVAGVEDLVSRLLVEEGRCAVLRLPESATGSLGRLRAALRRTLRGLASAGRDAFIVDLTGLAPADGEALGAVLGLMEEAERVGLQTALCASAPALREQLGRRGWMEDRLYPSRQAAREAFQ